jgi:hypothetical protein
MLFACRLLIGEITRQKPARLRVVKDTDEGFARCPAEDVWENESLSRLV